MLVVNVRVMRMFVRQRLVPVCMCVSARTGPGKCMRMLMMLVVVVTVPTFQRRMGMFVLLPLPDMPPDTEAHQRRCQPEQ